MTDFETLDRRLLPGFTRQVVDAGEGPIRALTAGEGPPLLMLHGDPQTHLCWHRIAPALTDRFTVVLTDLRGRGESHKPPAAAGPADNAYTKRRMAAEQVAVMQALGFERFSLVGHDRGARVARRMALDHPARIERLAVMDVVPALDLYDATTAALAQDYFYFFFLTQPHPQPEALIAGDAEGFMAQILTGLSEDAVPYDADALALYKEAASTPEAVTAMCECFRAGPAADSDHDRTDRAAERTIDCPTLVFWGETGVAGRHFDMRAVWRRWAPAADFAPLPCGHFIPEEAPDAASEHLRRFLSLPVPA